MRNSSVPAERVILRAGTDLQRADKVMLMLHGRGATASDILSISDHLNLQNAHLIAPQAPDSTWYPQSFLSPVKQNEPWLSSSLHLLREVLDEVLSAAFQSRQVYVLGFSQGACLTLEFVARNARPFGGVIAFTGGLIGETLNEENYKVNFEKTKIFIANSDKDPHVPLARSEESKRILEKLGADVTLKVYPGMAHTIIEDEIIWVNENILN